MPLEHDDRCNQQDRELTLLKEQLRAQTDTMREVVKRVQDLVEQYHAQNVAQTEMRGDVLHIRAKADEIEKLLEKNYALRSEFVEVKSEWRKFLGLILSAIALAAIGFVLRGGLK